MLLQLPLSDVRCPKDIRSIHSSAAPGHCVMRRSTVSMHCTVDHETARGTLLVAASCGPTPMPMLVLFLVHPGLAEI